MASRHLARSIVMQSLYEWDFSGGANLDSGSSDKAALILERNIEEFGPGLEDKAFAERLVEGVVERRQDIDNIIEKAAPEWPISQVAIVDRNILRIGLFELLFGNYKEVPPKVAINEAIELAKTFGGGNSSKFVNGVLGSVYREIGEPGKDDKSHHDMNAEDMESLPVEEKVGAVVYRKDPVETQFALVHDIFGYWTLAKGSPEKGETLEEAILREVLEETGLAKTSVIDTLGENQYVAHDPEKGKIRRHVNYFLVQADDADTQLKLKESGGLDDVRWFPQSEIEGLTMYDDVRRFFRKAFEIIK